MNATNRIRRPRSGFALIYCTIAMTVLLGLASLGVDLARVQVAKTELMRAADAAARYGVTGLGNNTAVSKAIAAASDNDVDGAPLVLQNSDIELGNWDSDQAPKFSTIRGPVNAIRVTARRVAARGTGI